MAKYFILIALFYSNAFAYENWYTCRTLKGDQGCVPEDQAKVLATIEEMNSHGCKASPPEQSNSGKAKIYRYKFHAENCLLVDPVYSERCPGMTWKRTLNNDFEVCAKNWKSGSAEGPKPKPTAIDSDVPDVKPRGKP